MSVVAGTRTAEQLVRYFAQVFAAQGVAVSDFNPLSVLRTIAEGTATLGERWEEELLVRIAEGIRRSTYRSFDFPLLGAARATGDVTFARASTGASQTLAAGATVRVPNSLKEYTTLDAVTMGIGVASASSRVRARQEGFFANTAAGTITDLLTQPTGALWTVVNAQAIDNGQDVESDEERVLRFRDYVQDIHRSTVDALAHGARTAALYDVDGNVVEAVKDAQVDEQYGEADVIIWNGSNTAPAASADLLARADAVLRGYTDGDGNLVPGYKAAGVGLLVTAATIVPVPVAVAIYPEEGYALTQIEPSVRAAILGVFARQRLGAAKLRLNDLRQAIGLTRGVIDLALGTPVADVAGGTGTILVPGAIAIFLGS
jgi:uncharacterized phage protein gp47/JayE